jgi:hypothetical protein
VLTELLPKVVDLCAYEKGGGVPFRMAKTQRPGGSQIGRAAQPCILTGLWDEKL